MNQEHYILSNAGVRMPKIIYGTAWKQERTADLVKLALQTGFRGIDTACQPKHYNEAGVGAALTDVLGETSSRADLYLQTKFTSVDGQDPQRIPYDAKAPLAEQVKQSIQTSLVNLGVEYLDCLILHSPLAKHRHTMEVWDAMSLLIGQGTVRQLGISNCYDLKNLERIVREADVKPAVLQNRFYADTGYDRKLREFCSSHEMAYQSFWTLTANPKILAHERLLQLATTYQRSPEQIFFRYLTQIGVIPLTGTASVSHMQEDLAIFEFELEREDCATITPLLR